MDYTKQWLIVLFYFFRSKTLKTLLPGLIIVTLYTTLMVYISDLLMENNLKITSFIYSLVGIVLGLLLVFRTNSAYERWWEGRKLLGTLLNNSRNFAIKVNAYVPDNQRICKTHIARLTANYAYALKEHLRNGVKFEELEETERPIIESLKQVKHVPNKIANLIFDEINRLYKNNVITDAQFMMLDKHLESLTDVMGCCERIKQTPIPQSYKVHLMKFIFLFILILPFGFIHDMEYWSVPVVMIIYYAFVGLDVIAGEIEDPFGKDANDLPTDEICKSIKSNVYEILHVNQPIIATHLPVADFNQIQN